MSSTAQVSSQAPSRTHSLKNRLAELAYKIFRATVAEEPLKLVDFGFTILPYQDVKRPAVSKWADLKDSDFSFENVLKLWERAKETGHQYYGVLLGRPSGHLVLIDLDDEDATHAVKAGREDEARNIVDDLAEKLEQILPKADTGLGVTLPAVLLTKTRRGVHILMRLTSRDYEELVKRLGKENSVLGETEWQGHQIKVELRVKGATPLHTKYHRTQYWQLPLPPVSLQTLERILQNLGVRLPESSSEERSSADTDRNGNRDVQNTIKSDEETHTPVTSSIGKDSARETTTSNKRRLSEQDIAKIVDVLKNYWVPGHRNNLQLGLVGWLIKRNVSLEQAEELVRRLAEAAGDEEVRKRIDEVRRQYRLVEQGEKQPQELLGKTGLLEQLQIIIKEQNPSISDEEARDRALSVISELEKILGPRRSIVIRTGYETGMWIVNDPRRGIVLVREKTDENGQVHRYRKYVSDWYVRRVLVVKGNGQYIYKVQFRNARTREKLVLAGSLDEITRDLKRLHGVKRSQHLYDAVSAIISEFIKRKLAKVKKTAAVAGILPVKDGVKLVRTGALSRLLIPKQVDTEKAKQALELLQKLREHYDHKKFDVAINWAAYAVASYALKKQFHVKQIYLLMHGEKQTGKTTLARIITSMFPVVTAEEEEIPEEGQSEYRLAWKLNVATVPVLEDEVQGISRKPSLLGLLKRASTGDLVRWRGDQNRRYHARAPLILTSNYPEVIDDPALRERIIPVLFTQQDYVYNKPREVREEFKKIYNEYRSFAPHLGAVLLQVLVDQWQEIAETWAHRLQEKQDYIVLGKTVWRWVTEKLNVKPPKWVSSEVKLEEEVVVIDEEEVFWEVLKESIREAIARHSRILEDVPGDLWTRINVLADRGLLPAWIYVRRDGVVITPGILREIERYTGRQVIGGLPGLAARLGYEYKVYKVRRRSVRGILIPYKVLVYEVATPEELARTVEDEVLFMIRMGKLRPVPQQVKDYIVKRWGLDEDTAYQLTNKILNIVEEGIKQTSTGQEEAVA